MHGNYVVALNTTNLHQNVLKITPVPSATIAGRAIDPMITPPPEIDIQQLLSPRGKVGSFLQSIGSDCGGIKSGIESKISMAIDPSEMGRLLLGGDGLGDGLGDLFGKNGTLNKLIKQGPLHKLFGNGTLSELFDGNGTLSKLLDGEGIFADLFKNGPLRDLFNNLGGQSVSLLVRLVNKLAGSAVESLELADQDSLYMRNYCSANMTTGNTQQIGPQVCTALRSLSIASPSNSIIQIGNTMIDYSAFNIASKLSGTEGLITGLFDAIFAFQVISIVGASLVFSLAIPLVFISSDAHILRFSARLIATIASVFLLIVSLIQITLAIAIPQVLNPFAEGLGVDATRSINFVVFVAVSCVFMSIISAIWTIHNFWTWHDKTYVARNFAEMDSNFDTPLASGRPIIKLYSGEDDRVREKSSATSKISAVLRIPGFGKMRATIRKPPSGSGVHVDDALPEETIYSPRALPKEYRPYCPA